MLGDMKLVRNGTYDSEEHEDIVPGSDQMEVVTRHYKESSCAVIV